MAKIVGVFAASHAPPIVREWENIRQANGDGLAQGFAELGQRIAAAEPDVLVVIAADHWANFFLNNMPSICIGVGAKHAGPPEPWLAAYPHNDMRGLPSFATYLAQELFSQGFEPSVSHELKLDHAFCVPLWKSGLTRLPPIVPVIINAIQPPLPTVTRCMDFGSALAKAIAKIPTSSRVVMLASGGLSHAVGEPLMGQIDETFDRRFFELLANGNRDELVGYLSDERVAAAGNGAAEIRFWLAAHGAAGFQGFESIFYAPIPETYTGCGLGEWKLPL